MTNERNPLVDAYIEKSEKWREELKLLRSIVLDSELTEEFKWGVPCYTLEKSNVVLIHVFKEYCALLFVKGSLLRDPEGILISQTEHTQASRQIRFTGVQEISTMRLILRAYLQEAIAAEKSGLKVEFKPTEEFNIPEEFQKKCEENPDLKKAFDALTPGRQRGYLLYFAEPKQSKTREARVEKVIPQILAGKGLHD